MTNEFIIANELLSLSACPVSLVVSAFAPKPTTERFLIAAQFAGLTFAFLAAVAIIASGEAPPVMPNQLLAVRIDAATACLLVVTFFISTVVTAYSDRYLSGDATRASFMRHVSILSSASGLLIASDNMILAFLCWVVLSIGLWKTIRLQPTNTTAANLVLRHHLASDLILMVAITLCISKAGIVRFSDLPETLHLLNLPLFHSSWSVGVMITSLLIVSFGIKSALFPFHRWLFATLEAPTPLSGLLHAGVVNVSAIMAWRYMPLMQEYSAPLLVWGIWSGISAIIGTLSMAAQPDVKRKLAYSTVGQMGFMSLQCATGAVAAALFHLVAHGLFKCHLFLQSGSAVSEGLVKRKYNYSSHASGLGQNMIILASLALLTLAISYLTISPNSSSWTVMSTLVAGAAALSIIPALSRIDSNMLLFFLLAVAALAVPSLVAGIKMEEFVHADQQINAWLVPAFLLTFAFIAILQALAQKNSLAEAVYVHSLNGFYIDDAGSFVCGRREGTHKILNNGTQSY